MAKFKDVENENTKIEMDEMVQTTQEKPDQPFKIKTIAKQGKIKIEDNYTFDLISGNSGTTTYSNGKDIDYKWSALNEAHKVTYKDFLTMKLEKPKMFSDFMLIVEDEKIHTNHEDIKEKCYEYYKVIDLSWVNKGANVEITVSKLPRSLTNIFLDNLKQEVKDGKITNLGSLNIICKKLNVTLEQLQS